MTLSPYVRPVPVVVEVGGTPMTIEPRTAAQWLVALSGGMTAIVPGMLDVDSRRALASMLVAQAADVEDMASAARDAIAQASDRPWWTAYYLVAYAERDQGRLYGALMLAGADPERLTLAAWCACLMSLVRDRMDDKAFTRFETDLAMPPAGVDPVQAAAQFDSIEW